MDLSAKGRALTAIATAGKNAMDKNVLQIAKENLDSGMHFQDAIEAAHKLLGIPIPKRTKEAINTYYGLRGPLNAPFWANATSGREVGKKIKSLNKTNAFYGKNNTAWLKKTILADSNTAGLAKQKLDFIDILLGVNK